jgi:peptidoglycan hydrolase-like protein with peptidoglycan-binding domain
VIRRFVAVGALTLVIATAAIPPIVSSGATISRVSVNVKVTVSPSLSANLPLLRLHFSAPTKARKLPPLITRPALTTKWEQIGPNDVQAVATSALAPLTNYVFRTPNTMSCAKTCSVTAYTSSIASVSTNLVWEAQLLAQLNYLPLNFTPGTPQSTPSEQVNGTFTWAYNLPTTLTSLWSVGTNNVVLRAALETFQSQSNLPVTGQADPTTWSDLLTAVDNNHVDPATYDYVSVTEQLPEHLTLYVAGKVKFTTLVNTGIEPVPTELGTFPVYERFLTTTMSGQNPNGTTYHDPDIPWVSYFNGGDALHGFIRASYGFPQSLGCVEMPFASAETVFPYTPIGTLVTVHD